MSKVRSIYVCTACEHQSSKWMGRCSECKAWNTYEERTTTATAPRPTSLASADRPILLKDVPTEGTGELRVRTGISELDNVLGGGLVAGSLTLVGGDPGVGKSTLLLHALDALSRKGLGVLYVSGEESVRQIHLRATRLGVEGDRMHLLAQTDWDRIEGAVREVQPQVVVIDSIQTVMVANLQSVPGSVTQVREVAHRCMILAKTTGTAIMLVGHVTKSGDLAGPKVLEHFVDTVLYFEGDGRSSLRVLRAVKNRFGPSGELGVFEMVEQGLAEVPDASARLLRERVDGASGTAVVAAIEGSRAILAEVQALVGRPTPSTPARTCVGVDRNRVLMLSAVLEKSGLTLHDRDLFINATGGLELTEPASDLGILAALASSLTDTPLDARTLTFGEVGLVGEIRAVSQPAQRLKEAARHGFTRVVAPIACVGAAPPGVKVIGVRTVREALEALIGDG
jgi:DNA repair protein RadA/Sms